MAGAVRGAGAAAAVPRHLPRPLRPQAPNRLRLPQALPQRRPLARPPRRGHPPGDGAAVPGPSDALAPPQAAPATASTASAPRTTTSATTTAAATTTSASTTG